MIAGGVVCLLGFKPFKGSGWRQFLFLVGQPPEERLTTAWTIDDQHESTKAFFPLPADDKHFQAGQAGSWCLTERPVATGPRQVECSVHSEYSILSEVVDFGVSG